MLTVAVGLSREARKWYDIIGPAVFQSGRREPPSGHREPPSRPRIVVLVNDEMWRPIPYAVIRETDGRDHAPESPWVFILPERLVGKRVSIWDELADRHIKNDILRRNLDGLYRIVVAGPTG